MFENMVELPTNQMNAYCLEDVLKIAFWMQSEVSLELKQRLLGKTSSILLKGDTRKEMEWRTILAKIFEGFDLRYNYPRKRPYLGSKSRFKGWSNGADANYAGDRKMVIKI